MRVWMMTAAAVIAAPAMAADQFDLVCKGTTTTRSIGGGATAEPFTSELRIDLKSRRYCSDECDATHPIFDAQPTFVAFEEGVSEPTRAAPAVHHWVDRRTGAYTDFLTDWRGSQTSTEAVCEPAPFKGFPSPPTKF